MNIYVYTLGCRVNQCESESILQSFLQNNWHMVKNYRYADLIIVNTCTVTSKAEQKARRMIRLFSESSLTFVTGCYTAEYLKEISDNVVLVPLYEKSRLMGLSSFIDSFMSKNKIENLEDKEAYFDFLKKAVIEFVLSLSDYVNENSSQTVADDYGMKKISDNDEDSFVIDNSDTGILNQNNVSVLSLPKGSLLQTTEKTMRHVENFLFQRDKNPFAYGAADFSLHSRSYLKIQDGCDNACAYCRTRVARGPSVFLEEEEVVRRAMEIEKAGYHEIVLCGVNLTMYNHTGSGLGGLLEKLLNSLGTDIRIRLSSMEADNVDDRFVDCLKDKRIQPYFHIPVQSASERVLKRINRVCTADDISNLVKKISMIRDNPLFACDVITGLPAEEEEDFKKTREFLIHNNFNLFHVFPFSPRPDTALYKAKDRPAESVRDRRAEELRHISDERYSLYVNQFIGKELEVIIEEKKGNIGVGLSGNYIKTEIKNLSDSTMIGDLKKVILKSDTESEAVN